MAEDSAEWLALSQQIGPTHAARVVEEEINRLDPNLWEAAYAGVGSEAHRPDLLLKIVVYEYLEGRTSPTQWARDVREHYPVRWLARGLQPSRSACYRFRDRMGGVIEAIHAEQIGQADAEGFLEGDTAVQDGTTIRACASRHRVVNQARLRKRIAALQSAIAQDAAREPLEQPPGWMAQTPGGRREQLERAEHAREVLEQRLETNAKKPKKQRLKEEHVQVSLSDPEAPLGRDKEKVFTPLYTTQFLVHTTSLLVLCWGVFAKATDAGTLALMLDRAHGMLQRRLKKVLADAGYATVLDLLAGLQREVQLLAPVQANSFTHQKRPAATKQLRREEFTWLSEHNTYRCPQGHLLDYHSKEQRWRSGDQSVTLYRFHCSPEHCQGCAQASGCVNDASKGRTIKRMEGQELLDAHRVFMSREDVKAEYKQRRPVIERAFGDAKQHRNFRRLHGRSLRRAVAEVGLLVLAQNTLTLHRLRQNAAKSNSNNT